MTTASNPDRQHREAAAQAEGHGGAALGLPVREIVPAHLLDGGEVVHFAIKPSPWYVPLVSLRWMAAGILLAVLANAEFMPVSSRWYLYQTAVWLVAARLVWATLEWVSRLYVLTNRRVLRLRGVFTVDFFECSLDRIQNTGILLSLPERLVHAGTISFQTASGQTASWRIVPKPLELHEQLLKAIQKAQNRGNHGA